MKGRLAGCNSEQGPACSDIDILGTRCKKKTGSHVGPWSVLFARLSAWGVRFAERVGRGQVASIRLGATGQRVEFGVQRSPAQTESAGVSVCSVLTSASLMRRVYASAVALRYPARTCC